jgi:hypothetical protein
LITKYPNAKSPLRYIIRIADFSSPTILIPQLAVGNKPQCPGVFGELIRSGIHDNEQLEGHHDSESKDNDDVVSQFIHVDFLCGVAPLLARCAQEKPAQ